MRSKKHEYEEEWHVQQLVLRHTSRRCEERQHMYRKGGRGMHQEHWNHPVRGGSNSCRYDWVSTSSKRLILAERSTDDAV